MKTYLLVTKTEDKSGSINVLIDSFLNPDKAIAEAKSRTKDNLHIDRSASLVLEDNDPYYQLNEFRFNPLWYYSKVSERESTTVRAVMEVEHYD